MKKVTIRDVAKAASVSINTVSRALNNKPDINSETKKQVLEAADKLGYRPNKLAQALRSKKTGTIGVIITDISNPFFSSVVKGAEKAAGENDVSVILKDSDENYENELKAIQKMRGGQVDGLLISPVQKGKDTIHKLRKWNIPFVLMGRHFENLETSYVITDDHKGGYLATKHLIDSGHQRLALINGPLHTSCARERYKGFKKALNEYGIEESFAVAKYGAIDSEDGYRLGKSLIQQNPRPTAVFAFSDFVAIGIMKAVREAGLRIPDDLAIVGYDDISFSSCLEVPLTSVRIPKFKLGEEAFQILHDTVEKKTYCKQLKLPVELIIRESTKHGGDSSITIGAKA